MEVNPLSIIFVKSDSKGDRLLFIYPYVTDNKSENERQKFRRRNPFALSIIEDLLQTPLPQTSNSYKGQLTGFTDEVLSTLFAVKPELCNRKFELKVNDVRFVGHPTLLPFRANKDEGTSSMILINVVFALQASASHSIVKCYYDLSKRLGKALRHEEKRCAYLSNEMKIMISTHDEMSALDSDSDAESGDEARTTSAPSANTDVPPQPKSPFDLILQRSSLSRSMKTVYEDLSKTGLVQVRINRWVLVSFCLPHKAHQMHNTGLLIEPETIDKCLQKLRPYHGILLMVDPNELLESMPLDGSPALLRLIKLYSPLKSLQTIAIEADLTLSQVFQLTGHLVYWAKATVIYPLCESNVYVIAPGAQLSHDIQLVEAFAKEFPGLSLQQVVSEFCLPAPLWYHARMGAGGAARLARVAAWLLRRRLMLQLHTYVQFRLSHGASRGEEYYCEKHSAYTTRPSGSLTSLNVLTPNINVEVESASLNAYDLEDSYPTENNLNQTNFSHTKPIVIESDTRTVLATKEGDASSIDTDSANHSLEDSEDVKTSDRHRCTDNNINTEQKKDNTKSYTTLEEDLAIKTPSDRKKLNGSSVDSGYSNILNSINKLTTTEGGNINVVIDVDGQNNNIIRKMELTLNGKNICLDTVSSSVDSESSDRLEGVTANRVSGRNELHRGTERIMNGNISNGASNTGEKKVIERTTSSNLKLDMSFQPPTVISSISTQNSCGGDSGEAPPNVRCSASAEPVTEETLLQDFTEDEKAAIFDIPAAHNPEDLALMAHLHKKGYFRGEQHLEEIMFMENLTRSQVLQLLDKFRAVLVTYETEDPAIAMLYAS